MIKISTTFSSEVIKTATTTVKLMFNNELLYFTTLTNVIVSTYSVPCLYPFKTRKLIKKIPKLFENVLFLSHWYLKGSNF